MLAVWGNANPYAMSVETLLQLTRDTPLGTPGHFAYSNLGMSLLGHAEARAAGAADWPALARQRLLVPLGMTNTTFVTAADQIPAGTATPHKDNGWRAPHWYGAAFTPAGSSTYTTAEDMMKYARAWWRVKRPAWPHSIRWPTPTRAGSGWPGSPPRYPDGRSPGTTATPADTAPCWPWTEQTGQAVLVLNSSTRSVDDPGAAARRRPHPPPSCNPPHYPASASDRSPPSSSVWCSWCPAPSPCSEPGTGSLPSAVPSTPSPGWCCYAYTGRGPSYRRNCGQPWPGWSLASVIVGSLHSKTSPVGPERHRWASITSVGFAVLMLLALVWTA